MDYIFFVIVGSRKNASYRFHTLTICSKCAVVNKNHFKNYVAIQN